MTKSFELNVAINAVLLIATALAGFIGAPFGPIPVVCLGALLSLHAFASGQESSHEIWCDVLKRRK